MKVCLVTVLRNRSAQGAGLETCSAALPLVLGLAVLHSESTVSRSLLTSSFSG